MGLLLLVLAALAPVARPQGTGEPREEPPQDQRPVHDDDLRRRDRPTEALTSEDDGSFAAWLLGWAGARERLADIGLDFEVLYTTDGSWAISSGADPGGTALRSLLDVTVSYDTEPVLGLRGGTLQAGMQWIHGVDASTRFGVLQAFSDIDADRRLQLSRVWYQQEFAASGTVVRVGKIDANSLFAYTDSGSHFMQSSMGFSPTILAMPTYPDASFGAAVVQPLGGGFELRGGVFDGSGLSGVRTGLHGLSPVFDPPHAVFAIGELDWSWTSPRPGRIGVGAWQFDGAVARFDGGTDNSTGGLYLTLDQGLWRAANAPEQRIEGFLQLGLADEAVSPFATHFGLGAVWHDAWASLREDRVGLGLSRVTLSGEPGAGFTSHDETAIELFLGFEPLPWMFLRQDIQYVVHPGGNAGLENAWIATLRMTLGL